jgi:PAS domain S-box-containing protein
MKAAFATALARGSDERLCSLSATGRVLSWSRVAEVLLGYDRADVIGRPVISLAIESQDIERFQEAMRVAVTHGASSCTLRLRGRDGVLDEPLPLKLLRERDAPDALALVVGRETSTRPPPDPAVVPTGLELEPGSARDQLLEEVDRALSSSFDATTMSERLARLLVPAVADWCAIDLAGASGTLRRVAATHREPRLARSVMAAGEETTGEPVASAALAHRLGRPLTEADHPLPPFDPRESPRLGHLRDAGLASYVVLPVAGRLRPAGVLSIAMASGARELAPADLRWLRDIARRLGLEMENARLADVVQRSREEARLAKERADLLQGLAAAVSEALTPREVTLVVVDQCMKALGANGGAIAQLRDASFELIGSVGPAEVLSNAWRYFPVHSRLPLSDAGRSGEVVLVEHLVGAAARYHHLAAAPPSVGALAAVALVVDGRRTGALGLTFPSRREFSEADTAFMRTIARVAADALERARLYDAERSARARASTEATRSGLLAEASRLLAESFAYHEALQQVARLLVPTVADWCAIHVMAASGGYATAAIVHSDPQKAPLADRLRQLPLDSDGIAVRALDAQQPQIYHNIPLEAIPAFVPGEERRRLLEQMGMRSIMVLPLAIRGRALGVMMLGHGGIRRFQSNDLPLAEELARRIAMGLDNARLYHEAQESEERIRLLVEGVKDHAFFMLDNEGRVASWNEGARRLLGHTSDEAIAAPLEVFYVPEDRRIDRPAQHLATALAEGRFEEEGWRARRDGSRFFAYTTLTALREPGGALRGFSLLVRDFSEQRRAREALDHLRQQVVLSEKLSTMGTLVSGVAHEIRTPLTAMANSLYGMRFRVESSKGKPLDEPLQATLIERLDNAIGGIDRINRLVEDLRRFHKLPAAARSRVGLHDVVAEALNLFQAAHRGVVEIDASLKPTPPCDVDRVQVQQAVLNLLQNAAEAMPHGGKVRLETGEGSGGTALVVVEDSGVGMPEEVRAHMFEEFFTTKPEGTGLGLSIVRRIVETHGGSIECESNVGKGTRFLLRFPSAQPPR